MARGVASPAEVYKSAAGPLPSITVLDWATDREAIRISLGMRREGVDLEAVPQRAANVYLVRREDAERPAMLDVVVDNQVQYSLSEEDAGAWLRVLRRIDGRRTLGEILQDAGVSHGEIRTFLEEAIDFGVVVLTDAAPPG